MAHVTQIARMRLMQDDTAAAPIGHAAPPAAGAKGCQRQSKARRGLGSFPTGKWTEVTMQVTKLLNAQSCDLRRVTWLSGGVSHRRA